MASLFQAASAYLPVKLGRALVILFCECLLPPSVVSVEKAVNSLLSNDLDMADLYLSQDREMHEHEEVRHFLCFLVCPLL